MTEESHKIRLFSTANYTISSLRVAEACRRLHRDFPAFDKRNRRNILIMSRYLDAFTYKQITFHFKNKLRRVK